MVVLILHLLDVFSLLFALYRIEFHNNFFEVVPGVLYRSGEMPPQDLEEIIQQYAIASVLDLRISGELIARNGMSEHQLVTNLDASYVNVPLATTRVPTKEELLHLEETLHSLTTPILIHCSTGALRTGVVTSLWLQEVTGVSPEEAKKQLSPYFGYSYIEYVYKKWTNGHPPLPYFLYRYWSDQKRDATFSNFHSWLMAGTTGPDNTGKLSFKPADLARIIHEPAPPGRLR
jgi:protein tyrosine phosphatase (PTP) superfamily phosphohydrolase (DUF442 family)